MEKVESSREMLEELSETQTDQQGDLSALTQFAKKIGTSVTEQRISGYAEYGVVFRNCVDIINLRQQIEQSDVLSKQTEALFKQSDALSKQTIWIRRYTYATFALVVVTALIAIFR